MPESATAAPPLQVSSETAPLRQVVVHTPGEEMALVAPGNKDELLFDDLLFVEEAREEHATLVRLFEAAIGDAGAEGGAVLQLSDLLREAFDGADARESFVEALVELLPERNFEAYEAELKALGPDALHRFALTGQAPFAVSATPLPNLLFTRDLSAVVGDHPILSLAATAARRPESAIIRTIYHHHPRFAAARERLIELPEDVTFEGGDLLVVNERVVMIGQSERTSLGGVLAVARALLDRTSVEHVLMVNLPKERYCMHLDTVFTFADDDTCVVFPPIIEEPRDHVLHIEAGAERGGDGPREFRMRPLPSVREALEEVTGRSYTFIPCGGADPIRQRREQWTDGANLFAVRPGLVVGYARNRATYEALARAGFHVVSADDFLGFYGDAAAASQDRIAVRLSGNELSRGRGGPRCMTMPLVRMRNSES
ncbi:arginine deiminase family protein [Rubrivirga litoralis]|uniref:arginine deiminase n=1 Tax=Rubrivirga litoralis TaxID=3075598 RepID=A0ABU3BP50_9BACT|nr:arginine deiminase family protein [Rubrivirga sp. F394]MDT0631038.1 arginine deiminase family protein [Rubrivirga sp. F394]